MKTILHIITGLNDGGAEGSLFQLCRHDTANRHEVISLTGHGKYGPLLEAQGIPVLSLDMPRGRVTPGGLRRLYSRLRAARPDVVQTWMYHADLLGGGAARLAGHRNICWGIHHSDLGQAGTARSTVAVARLCARLSRRIPRAVICCAVKSKRVHAAFGYAPERLVVVPNGYDLSVFRPDPAAGATLRAQLGLSPDVPVIGFVARYDPLKDHTNLLTALAQLNTNGDAPICLLAGTGMEQSNAPLAAEIARLGLTDRVKLLGRRDDVPAVMNALDVHVMSSASEAFPNVLAEAMASGTPCIATDVGDATEILGDTGWIVPTRDPDALAGALRTALAACAAPGWANRCEEARARVAARFSIEQMVESYNAVWDGSSPTSSA